MKKLFILATILLFSFISFSISAGSMPGSPPVGKNPDFESVSVGVTGHVLKLLGGYTVATIPASPAQYDLIVVLDGDTACDTTTGGGALISFHYYSGAAWVCLGDGGAGVFQIDGASDLTGEGTVNYVLHDDGDGTYSFQEMTAAHVSIADGGDIITETTVEGALQENRTAINLNTAKETNVSTALSAGTVTATTYGSTWTPITTVNAEIFTRYDFSDGTWDGNKYWDITDTPGDGTWYYAVTSIEWSGLESRAVGNIFSITVASGSGTGEQDTAYPADPGDTDNPATSDFYTSYNAGNTTLIRYYNIYAEDGSTPTISQTNRIASIPATADSEYIDWLGNSDDTTLYTVTAVDTQGNESTALDVTRQTDTPVAGMYSLSWSETAAGSTHTQIGTGTPTSIGTGTSMTVSE